MFLIAVSAASTAAAPALVVHPWLWVGFCAGMAALLLLDMFVFHRHAHEPSLRESALWTVFWCTLALAFNALVWWLGDWHHAVLFLTGYLIEWSLSMDNVFVFVVIFSFFGVPLKYQYRVLFWGILGAILMRLTFILAAGKLLEKWDWVMYIFGAFLVYTGYKLARSHGGETHPDQNLLLRFARKYLRVAEGSHGDKFFVRQNGKLFVTSLFLVLLVIESTDVVFAIDSVPAIFGVTKDAFIVFTSNVFAIMGLRAVLHARRRDGIVPLFALRAQRDPGVHRREDARARRGANQSARVAVGNPVFAGDVDRGIAGGRAAGSASIRAGKWPLRRRPFASAATPNRTAWMPVSRNSSWPLIWQTTRNFRFS